MKTLYLFIFLSAVIIGAFFVGKNVGKANCKAEYSIKQNLETKNTAKKIIKITEVVNEKVYNTDTADIRDVLRKKYTIAD